MPDKFNLKKKSDSELYNWLSLQEHDSEEYNAGIRETMERIAIVEEKAEKNDPVMKREFIAMAIAIIALAITIVVIIVTQSPL